MAEEANMQAEAQEKKGEAQVQVNQLVHHQACWSRSEGCYRPECWYTLLDSMLLSVPVSVDLEHRPAKIT